MGSNQKHVIVVGAGPGGLTAAMLLAKRGLRVTVLEAKDTVGGRNAAIRQGPYTFDTGPTFLMLKEVLDEVFLEAGTSTEALMDVQRLEPMYRLQFADKSIEPTTDHVRMKEQIARVFPGHEDAYDCFFVREKARFKALFPCLQRPYHKLSSLLSPDLLKAIPHLGLGKSLFDIMYGYFGDQDLALAFTFQSKYLGMSPWDCPGLFAMVPYIEHGMGIFHAIGGLSRISDCMADVARGHGADIRLSTPVDKVVVKQGRAVGVRLEDGSVLEADELVLNADFGYAMEQLFEPGVIRKYAPSKLARKKLSCSTYMLYLGLNKRYEQPHHTVFFARDYRANVEAIFGGRNLTDDISFYVRDASATDPTLAPEGHSAIYVLVPVPNLRGEIDWQQAETRFRELTLAAIEARSPMHDIREHIQTELAITPEGWRDDYNVYEGATFNLGHNLSQMVFLRPRNKFEEVDNCYLAGGGTHPGSGLPTIYESGRIAANLICRRHGVDFFTRNLLA